MSLRRKLNVVSASSGSQFVKGRVRCWVKAASGAWSYGCDHVVMTYERIHMHPFETDLHYLLN